MGSRRRENRGQAPRRAFFIFGLVLMAVIIGASVYSFTRTHRRGGGRFHDVDDDDGNNNGGGGGGKPLVVDYAIVGQGIGGVSTAYWLSEALKRDGQEVSVAAFEASSSIGGNIHATKLKKPANYDGSLGDELLGDQGAQRTAQMTLGMKRRLLNQFGIEVMWSPFEGEYHTRGRRLNCGDPSENAFSGGTVYERSPSTGDFDAYGDMAFAYGSLCLSDELFVGTPATQYDSAFPNTHNPSVGANDGTTDNSYFWLLEGSDLDVIPDEPDLDTGNYNFCLDSTNPVTGESCTGLRCGGTVPECPIDLAQVSKDDWATHVARMFAFNSSTVENPGLTSPLNYDYKDFMEADNLGFLGDYRDQFSAYSYTDWQIREWGQTNNIFGYLPGGERRLLNAMHRNATENGVDTYLGERVVRVERTNRDGAKYRLRTSKGRTVLVRNFLFLNTPPYYLFKKDETDTATRWPGSKVSGDIIDELREVREVQAPLAASVLRVLAQWEPGKKAWFWDLYDLNTGNKSYRLMGDSGCFSRTEFIDTPYHRCTNHVVPVYTDDECERMWLSYAEEYKQTGDDTLLKQRVVDEMKASFPELADNIDAPVLVDVTHFKSAWHWAKRSHGELSNAQITTKAAAPLGESESIALVAEAYGMTWGAWTEGALRSSKRALLTRFDGTLGDELSGVFDELFDIFRTPEGDINDFSFASPAAYIPPLFDNPDPKYLLNNELWWPYGPYNELDENSGDFCSAQKLGLTPFRD